MKINKTKLLLLIIIVLSLILRLYAAYHTDVATDEMIYSLIPFNIISAHRLSTVEQSPVYFYLDDIGYAFSGDISALSARITSVIFGALAVLVIFLITKELFREKKAALLAGFFFAVSGHALHFNIEMDMVAYFFVLLGIYFLIKAWKGDEKNVYYSFLFLALAVMVKRIAFLFFMV